MTTTIRRNLVIGLGGTGLNAVYSLKRKYESVFGTQRPLGTRFLVLDTTDAKPSGGVSLQPAEFIKLAVPDASRVLQQNPAIRRWFPTEPAIPLGAIDNGAGQLRPLGRLALFHNAGLVWNSIRQNITEARAIRNEDEEGGVRVSDQPILVQVIGSLSGGTGAGTFLDIAHICRSMLWDGGQLVGMILLPDAFIGKPATTNVEANAYAAMKELDYYMGLTQDQVFEYMFGNEKLSVQKPPFSVVYLVNNSNNRGLAFTDVNDVYDNMSMAAYLSSGGAGQGATDIMDNLRLYIGTDFNGKRGYYAAVGVSELVLDREQLASEMAIRAALDAINVTFDKTSGDDVDREVSEFLEANNLVEHERDQLIDSLLPPRQFRRPALDDVVGRKDLTSLAGIADPYRNAVRTESRKRLDESRPEFEGRVLPKLEDRISLRLNQPGGLTYTIIFLNRMIGRLEAFRHEMTQEATEFGRSVDSLKPTYDRILQEAQERSGSLFTGRGAVREIVGQLSDLLFKEAQGIAEGMRRNVAAEVYTKIIDVLRERLTELDGLRERVQLVERRLQRQLEELTGRNNSRHPFRMSINVPQRFRDMTMDSRAFVTWLADEGGGFRGLMKQDAEALAGTFKEFGRAQPAAAEAAALTIDQVLRAISSEERMRYVKRLDEMAAPMWSYDAATVHSVKVTEKILLFGVEDLSKTVLNRDELKDHIAMTGEPFFAEVGDPERIYVYKVELVAPGYTISGMHRYKASFERLRRHTPFHLEPEFDRDPQRDLFPVVGGSEALKAWSLANAPVFGLIQRSGANYLIHSPKKGERLEGHMIRLGQGRVRSSQALMDDPELVEEVLEAVRRVLSSRGVRTVVDELERYTEELARLGSNATDIGVRNLIASELDAIDEYITENTTMT